MTREDYERRRRQLDEELRAGIELLEAAHRTQVRALELVWSTWFDGATTAPGPPAAASPAPPPAPAPRKGLGQVRADAEAVLEQLPPVFDRNDVSRALGYEPDRVTLYKALVEMVEEGILALESRGSGNVPARYRRA